MTKRVHAKRTTTRTSAVVAKVATSRAVLAAAAAAGVLAATSPGRAADTWTDGTGDRKWFVGGNWLDGTVPTKSDDVIFPDPVPAPPGSNVAFMANEFARSLTFNESYNLLGGSAGDFLSIATGSVAVDVGRSAVIEVNLNGTAGLLKSGDGTLITSISNGW